MAILVTGSSGHLGEGLVRTLRRLGRPAVGIDRLDGPFTDHVGSIADPAFVRRSFRGVEAVVHAATLHKPHLRTHSAQAFVETNVLGTAHLLEAAREAGVHAFVQTSTTSAFGDALHPGEGEPAAWITEEVLPRPRNVYGATKLAAEHLCESTHRDHGLPCIVLRTSRFFLEEDDSRAIRADYDDDNVKLNEFLHRRVDLGDAVDAHLAALDHAEAIGFGCYVVSATTPFSPEDGLALRDDPARLIAERFPEFEGFFERRGWRMFPSIDRVYVNQRARDELGWRPRFDFGEVLARLMRDEAPHGALAGEVGKKPYHDRRFEDGPYPV